MANAGGTMSGNRILRKPIVFGWATIVTLGLSVGSLTANAQLAGATLSGQVLDESGAGVAGANVVIENNATGDVRTATTDTQGLYSAQSLQPGIYSVTVTAAGFATHVEK